MIFMIFQTLESDSHAAFAVAVVVVVVVDGGGRAWFEGGGGRISSIGGVRDT